MLEVNEREYDKAQGNGDVCTEPEGVYFRLRMMFNHTVKYLTRYGSKDDACFGSKSCWQGKSE